MNAIRRSIDQNLNIQATFADCNKFILLRVLHWCRLSRGRLKREGFGGRVRTNKAFLQNWKQHKQQKHENYNKKKYTTQGIFHEKNDEEKLGWLQNKKLRSWRFTICIYLLHLKSEQPSTANNVSKDIKTVIDKHRFTSDCSLSFIASFELHCNIVCRSSCSLLHPYFLM